MKSAKCTKAALLFGHSDSAFVLSFQQNAFEKRKIHGIELPVGIDVRLPALFLGQIGRSTEEFTEQDRVGKSHFAVQIHITEQGLRRILCGFSGTSARLGSLSYHQSVQGLPALCLDAASACVHVNTLS